MVGRQSQKPSLIKWLYGSFRCVLEQLKGRKRVTERIVLSKRFTTQLTGQSLTGYEITIYCQKRHYHLQYEDWFIPNRNLYMYEVYGLVSNDAPEVLKAACQDHVCIPELLPNVVPEDCQEKEAIQAFLDIVINRMGVHDMSLW
jgi:hypothetical protein